MKLTILERLHTEYLGCWTIYDAAKGEAAAISAAVADRIKSERAHNEAHIADLQTQADDPARSETVRRLARLEIDKAGGQTYGPNPAEVEALNEQLEICKTAIADAAQIREKSREFFTEAEAELASMRKTILGDQRRDLAPRHIERLKTDFERLGGMSNGG